MKKLFYDLWVIFFVIKNLLVVFKWLLKKLVCLDRKKKYEGIVLFWGGIRMFKDGEIENVCKWWLWKLKLCFLRWIDCDVVFLEYDNRRNIRFILFIL